MTSRSFELLRHGVRVSERNMLSSSKVYVVNFFETPIDGRIERSRPWAALLAAAICLVFGGFLLLAIADPHIDPVDRGVMIALGGSLLIASTLLIAWYFAGNERWLVFGTGAGRVRLYEHKPTPEAVNQFVTAMGKSRRKLFAGYLAEHRATDPEFNSPSALLAMRDQGLISHEDYEEMKRAVSTPRFAGFTQK